MSRLRTYQAFSLIFALSLAFAVPALAGWTTANSVAPLPLERAGHMAVVLPNGKVLATGGCVGWKYTFTPNCSIYDPASNTWTDTGAMSTPRAEHGLVLLPNGKVLAIGGYTKINEADVYLDSCDLYDPATGVWTPTGSMITKRTVFSTNLLPNGKVLVAGGLNENPSGDDEYLAVCELYDPATGTWSATGSLAQSRSAHTGTLLPNGKVLAVAGAFGFTALASAEEYDPASGTWASAGNTPTAHAGHTATLLQNGKVLVAAGAPGLFIGNSAELYDPVARTWASTGALVKARALHTATLLNDGRVLAAGGGSGFTGDVLKNPMADAELYDPVAGTWSATDSMPFVRSTFPACLLPDGRVIVIGGLRYESASGSYYTWKKTDIYTPPAACSVTCSATAAPTAGNIPLTVQFTGTATATGCTSAPAYSWTFGDGTSSGLQSPSHAYAGLGTFTWTLTVTADGKTCTRTGSVTVSPAAVGALAIGAASGAAGSNVCVPLNLTNTGTPGIASLTGDITYDSSKLTPTGVTTPVSGKIAQGNIVSPGTYRITVYGGTGAFPNGAAAQVCFATTAGQCATYPLAFASGSPTASDANAYPAQITGTGGSLTTTGCQVCTLACTASAPLAGIAGAAVLFQATATATGCAGSPAFAWTFGDGGTSNLQSPTHAYAAVGAYSWTLTVTADGQTCAQTGSIEISAPPQCSLSCMADAAPTSGNAPLAVGFTSQFAISDCSGDLVISWLFGDGGTSDLQNPSHTYAAAGTYNWVLTATMDGQTCSDTGTVVVTSGGGKPGDCDGNGTVSIGEVQKSINMYLGLLAPGCGVDCNGNGVISIGEVQKVINVYLGLATSC